MELKTKIPILGKPKKLKLAKPKMLKFHIEYAHTYNTVQKTIAYICIVTKL